MINEILEDREKRYNHMLELIERYKLPIICGKINYPGENKNTEISKKAFEILYCLLNSEFNGFSVHSKILNGFDGSSYIMVVDLEGLKAKLRAVEIEENHPLGRIFDIDVYETTGISIGRENIKKNPRKCIICSNDARICVRLKNHSLEELLEEIKRKVISYGEEYEK